VTERAVAIARSTPAVAGVVLAAVAVLGLTAAYLPDVALGITLSPVVVSLFVYWVYSHVSRHRDAEFLGRYYALGIALRVVAVVAQLVIGFVFYRGEVDFVGYWNYAMDLFQKLVLEGRVDLLFDPQFVRSQFFSRSTMIVSIVVVLMMLVVGPNIIALFFLGVPLSAAAAYIFYRAFETLAPDEASRRRFARFMWFFPSVAFWSVFLGKDVWVFLFLSTATLAVARLLDRPKVRHVVLLAVSLQVVILLRPHVGATVLTAAIVALLFRPLRMRGPWLYVRPVLRFGMVAVLVGGFALMASMALSWIGVSALTLEALAERAYGVHLAFAAAAGGSALEAAIDHASPAAVAGFIPFGVMTLLFRPFLWEAHNAVAVVAAIENLFLVGLVLVRLPSIWRALVMAPRHPMAVFAIVAFALTAVALAFDWNLGAAQRHRTMVMPFLFMMLALPGRRPAPEARG
jgi:hypothetical protein